MEDAKYRLFIETPTERIYCKDVTIDIDTGKIIEDDDKGIAIKVNKN